MNRRFLYPIAKESDHYESIHATYELEALDEQIKLRNDVAVSRLWYIHRRSDHRRVDRGFVGQGSSTL